MPCLYSLSRNHVSDPGARRLVFNRYGRVMMLLGSCWAANETLAYAHTAGSYLHHCGNYPSASTAPTARPLTTLNTQDAEDLLALWQSRIKPTDIAKLLPPTWCPASEPPMPCLYSLSRNHVSDPGARRLVFNRYGRVMMLLGSCWAAKRVGFAMHPAAHFHAPRCPKLRSPPLVTRRAHRR